MMQDIIIAITQGFLTAIGLIAAIGAQNAFVLSQALKRNHAIKIALTCIFFDVLLIACGVGGLGFLLEKIPSLAKWMAISGMVFLLGYGVLSFKRAFANNQMIVNKQKAISGKKAILISVSLTLLNPHVYLDTVFLIGSIANAKFVNEKWFFAIGCGLASVVWFLGLVLFAKLLEPLFKKPVTWKVLDFLIGLIMWMIAYSLIKYV